MHIYCWHDRRYNTIVIDTTSKEPAKHAEDRCYAHDLIYSSGSLRTYELQPRTKARDIVAAVGTAMRAVSLQKFVAFEPMHVYGLRNNLYEDAAQLAMRSAAVAEREWRLAEFGPEPEARQGDRADNDVK